MIKFLHLADLHLGWEPSFLQSDLCQTRKRERDSVLKRAVDYALKPDSQIQFVLIVGDLFETHDPPEDLAREVLSQLGRLQNGGIEPVVVPGNHDEISYHNSVYRRKRDEWPGHLITNPMPNLSVTLEVAGTKVYIYSMAYTGGLTDVKLVNECFERESDSGVHIAAFHGSLDWDAGERSLPLYSESLAGAGYDYVALGHIHQHQVHSAGTAFAVYPGIIEPKHLSETGSDHLCVPEITDDGVDLNKPKISIRRHSHEQIDVSTAESIREIIDLCSRYSDPEAIASIKLVGTVDFPIDVENLEHELMEEFFHISLDDETHFIPPSDAQREIKDDISVRGEFVRRMHEKIAEADDQQKRKLYNLALSRGLAAFGGKE